MEKKLCVGSHGSIDTFTDIWFWSSVFVLLVLDVVHIRRLRIFERSTSSTKSLCRTAVAFMSLQYSWSSNCDCRAEDCTKRRVHSWILSGHLGWERAAYMQDGAAHFRYCLPCALYKSVSSSWSKKQPKEAMRHTSLFVC